MISEILILLMLKRLTPVLNTPVIIPRHTLAWIRSGHGLLEVDFKTYSDVEDRLLFLSPGQYMKFIFGEFDVLTMEIPAEYVVKSHKL